MRSVLIDGGMPQGGAIHDIRGLEAHGSGTAPRRHVSRVWTDDDREEGARGEALGRSAQGGRGHGEAERFRWTPRR
jgi:hypothetical protein